MPIRVLIAGGVYRKSCAELASIQPTPEMVLSAGLSDIGVEVSNSKLEDLWTISRSRSADIVHVHHLSKAAVVAGALGRSTKFVFTRHGTERLSEPRQRAGLRVIMARMDAGVCLSNAERIQTEAAYPASRSKLHVIPNGIQFPNSEKVKQGFSDGRIGCLFVGQLIALKRVDMILQAMVDDVRYHLRLVYHNDSLERHLMAKARSLGVEARVEFVGKCSGDALYSEYRNADVLLLPSESEALPSVVSEALSMGVPVIASDVGGIREQVGDAGILFNPVDGGGLRSALRQFVGEKEKLAANAQRRSREVRQEYSVQAMIERHLSLYERLLGGAR